MRNAHIRDGAAVVSYLAWLDAQVSQQFSALFVVIPELYLCFPFQLQRITWQIQLFSLKISYVDYKSWMERRPLLPHLLPKCDK